MFFACGSDESGSDESSAHGRTESIAAGNSTAPATLEQWKAIPGDNASLLDPAFTVAGQGRASGGMFGVYWTIQYAGQTEPSCN